MQLETVNKLYLELSQVATAKTANDLKLEKALALVKQAYPKLNSEYLTLLNKYAGTRFENDPPLVALRDWVNTAHRLIAGEEYPHAS